MKVQDVIVIYLATRSGLKEFGWERPCVHVHAAGNQQINGAMFSRFDNHHRADWTREAILTSIVIKAHTHRDVVCGQFHVSAV